MHSRILLYNDSDVFAGTERHIADLAFGLAQTGGNVAVGCPTAAPLRDLIKDPRIEQLTIEKVGAVDRAAIRLFAQKIKLGEIDLIHVHNGRTALNAAIAIQLAGRGKLVMTQHFLSPARTTRRGIGGLCSRLAHGWLESRITSHIAISQAVREASISAGITDPPKIQVVPNGIRLPERVDPQSVLDSDPWFAEGNPRIFCAARAEPEKDLATLVAAMRELQPMFPTARCMIAGGGGQLESLREMAAKPINHGTSVQEPNVRLLGFRSDVASWMSAADIFVLPSPAEAFGLVLLEAMALGKPIVACAAGGPCEIVEPEKTGFLVPPKSPSAMAQALATLAADPKLRQSMGQAGYRRYLEMFTASRMAERIADVYREALSRVKT